jgi:hypothetical protein
VGEDNRPGPAELEAKGLYEPDAEDAAERLALLEFLVGLGATISLLRSPVSFRYSRRRSHCGVIASG